LIIQKEEPKLNIDDDYDGNESEEEERMLEEMTRGYVMEDFEFGLHPNLPCPGSLIQVDFRDELGTALSDPILPLLEQHYPLLLKHHRSHNTFDTGKNTTPNTPTSLTGSSTASECCISTTTAECCQLSRRSKQTIVWAKCKAA